MSRTPCDPISRGNFGSSAKASTSVFTRREGSSSRQRSKAPRGRSACGSIAVSSIRNRRSFLTVRKSASALTGNRWAATPPASSATTTTDQAWRTADPTRFRAFPASWASIASRSTPSVCALSSVRTSSQPSRSRTWSRSDLSPSREGTARTTAFRQRRGRFGPTSSTNRFASALGFPASEAAFGPRTAKWNSPSSAMSGGPSGSRWTLAPASRASEVSVFAPRTSSRSVTSTASVETRFAHASWCICFRFGRCPRRQAVGRSFAASRSEYSASSRNQETSVQRRRPFCNSMPSGPVAPTSASISGVCAFDPMGCELRNTETTACSISRKRSLPLSAWMFRAFCSSPSSTVFQALPPFSTAESVATWARPRAASAIPSESGFGSSTAGPTSGLSSQLSASRSAMANSRRIPRVRWNRSNCVQRL